MAAPRSGPTAKQRPEDRLGHRTAAEQASVTQLNVRQEEPPPVIPSPEPDWAPVAVMMWDAWTTSPLRELYESTDYAACHLLCSVVTEITRTGYRAGQLQTVREMMRDLLFTETARRAADIQITRTQPVQDPARVAAMATARARRS